MNCGYWSSSCEAWFLSTLTKIRAGERGLTNQATWRSELRRSKRAKDVLDSVTELSSKFLKEIVYCDAAATRSATRTYVNAHLFGL